MNFWNKLKKPFFVLAPMQDVTDFVFREIIVNTARPDVFFTEFTNTRGLFSDGREFAIQQLKYSEKQRPIVAQIWGNDPENFYKSAKLISELGFDGVDINTGCPDRDVINGGSGSALITKPNIVKEIILATKEGAGDIPVSVKTRLGFDKVITEDWIGFLLEQDLQVISIHGRIASEMSRFPADWDEIGKCVKLRDETNKNTLIVGNGDVLSYAEGIEKSAKYGVDGIMIGRGIFQNPWIFEKDSKEHTTKEYIDILKRHTKLFYGTWGNGKNFEIMKKFFKVYIRDFKGASQFRNKIMKIKTHDEFLKIIDTLVY